MKRISVIVIAALSLAAGIPGVDWKLYALTGPDGAKQYRLYEANRMKRDGNRVQVWTEILGQKFVEDWKPTTEETRIALLKAGSGYMPPIASYLPMNTDLIARVSLYEVLASGTGTKPDRQALYEMDCSNQTGRVISVVDKTSADDEPSTWAHFPPGSSGETLFAMACDFKKPTK